MEYATEKWGGLPHYRGVVRYLGDDEFGCWLWGPVGRTIFRGDTPMFVTEQAALILIATDCWWTPSWWIGHNDVEIYVNINTPVRREGDRFVSVDVDLDVVGFRDGRVEVVDQDEFVEHQRLFGYPRDVIDAAESAATAAHDLLRARVPPFDGVAAEQWAARA